MKKILLTLVLLVGVVFGLFAQKLTYQAVVRDNNQQLVVNTAVKATVTIAFSTGNPYTTEVNGSTNIHGLLSFEFGGDALNGRNWEGATIAVKVVNAATQSTVYVNDDTRPVSAVPYALSVDGTAIQQYLDANHYVTDTQVGQQIRDSIANIGIISISDETLDAVISAPTAEICDLVMECLGDTLGKLNEKIEDHQNTVPGQENIIDNLSNNVDLLNNLTPDGQPCLAAAMVKDAQNHNYPTVKIGNQCWMKENLRTGIIGGYGNVNIDGNNVCYYDWAAVMQGASGTNYPESGDKVQGICPNGWHVPSQKEWNTLIEYVSSIDAYKCNDGIANALTTVGWSSPDSCCAGYRNSETLNKTGFSAIPAGFYSDVLPEGLKFHNPGNFTLFWSATDGNNNDAWGLALSTDWSSAQCNLVSKTSGGFSVRCLRDAGIGGKLGDNEVACPPLVPKDPCCSELSARIDNLENTIASQKKTIDALNEQLESLMPFECGKSRIKDFEGNKYNTVKIGNQCWTVQNLRTKKYANGDEIPSDKLFNPGNSEANVENYGLLYTWSATTRDSSTTYPAVGQLKVQGVCPNGWHVPSDAEWDTLTRYVFSIDDYKCGSSCGTWQAQNDVSCIANALSSSTGWQSSSECAAGHNSTTLNATGFSAVPAGYCFTGNFHGFGGDAYFWSATQSDGANAWCRYLSSGGSRVTSSGGFKGNGFSVRCLRD